MVNCLNFHPTKNFVLKPSKRLLMTIANKIIGIDIDLIKKFNIDLTSDPFEILFILTSNNIQFECIECYDVDGNLLETFKPSKDENNT